MQQPGRGKQFMKYGTKSGSKVVWIKVRGIEQVDKVMESKELAAGLVSKIYIAQSKEPRLE